MGPDKMARFGSARTRTLSDKDRKVTFADVAGADEEKEELREIVDFLQAPQKYLDLGARIPKGVLLVGPPGTGKTLLAKAVAGEAGVQFLSISGSDFVELYVGVGASRVRDLFEEAKKVAPAVVFIDEIDAVGRQRGAGLGGGHDEREQTLNQLLVEMDGFTSNEGVVVLAATNRADILDPALLRPGRFDRQIYVGRPDLKGREEILRVHARNKPLAEDVDLRVLAQSTPGFSGADLENVINEGALLSARRGQKFITMDMLQEAVVKVIAGPEKKSRVVPPHERRLTAYHEAGHAVMHHCLASVDPVHSVTIIPRGQAGGMTISLPGEDRGYYSRRYMEEEIAALLGGRTAEELFLGDISTGASNDLQRASAMARRMVTAYGMSDRLGTVAFESGQRGGLHRTHHGPRPPLLRGRGRPDRRGGQADARRCLQPVRGPSCGTSGPSWRPWPGICWTTRPWSRRPSMPSSARRPLSRRKRPDPRARPARRAVFFSRRRGETTPRRSEKHKAAGKFSRPSGQNHQRRASLNRGQMNAFLSGITGGSPPERDICAACGERKRPVPGGTRKTFCGLFILQTTGKRR